MHAYIKTYYVILIYHIQTYTTDDFETRFKKTKTAVKKLQNTDENVKQLIILLAQLFYCKDNQEYNEASSNQQKSIATRFLTKYIQFMLCITK